MTVAGKTALVTGAARGIGLAVRLGYWALMRGVSRRTQAWREPRESTTLGPPASGRGEATL